MEYLTINEIIKSHTGGDDSDVLNLRMRAKYSDEDISEIVGAAEKELADVDIETYLDRFSQYVGEDSDEESTDKKSQKGSSDQSDDDNVVEIGGSSLEVEEHVEYPAVEEENNVVEQTADAAEPADESEEESEPKKKSKRKDNIDVDDTVEEVDSEEVEKHTTEDSETPEELEPVEPEGDAPEKPVKDKQLSTIDEINKLISEKKKQN